MASSYIHISKGFLITIKAERQQRVFVDCYQTERSYTFLDPHLYLYTKFYKTCSLLTAQFSTNIPRPHLLYNLVKALHAVASCITSSGINRGSCVQHYVALDGAISAAKKISLRWRWKLPHYTNLTSLSRFLYKRVKQGFGYRDGSNVVLPKNPYWDLHSEVLYSNGEEDLFLRVINIAFLW